MTNADIVLAKVVDAIEKYQKETGIEVTCYVTLMVNGILLTGSITSFDKYMKYQYEKLQGKPQSQLGLARVLPDLFAKIKNEVEISEKESKENRMPEYIHLNNVYVINTNGEQLNINGIFRVRLSDVSGFNL